MNRDVYVRLPKWLLEAAGLSLRAKNLLVVLDDHKNPTTGLCCPRLKTLARELECTERSIKRALRELRERALIRVRRSQRGNRYEVEPRSEWHISMGTSTSPRKHSHGDKYVPMHGDKYVPSEPPASTINQTKVTKREESSPHNSSVLMEASGANGSGSASAGCDFFSLFQQCFVRFGVAVSAAEWKIAKRIIRNLPKAEHIRMARWLEAEVEVWRPRETRHIPHPLTVLREERWLRVAAERTVPRPPAREEQWERFEREFARRQAERMRRR